MDRYFFLQLFLFFNSVEICFIFLLKILAIFLSNVSASFRCNFSDKNYNMLKLTKNFACKTYHFACLFYISMPNQQLQPPCIFLFIPSKTNSKRYLEFLMKANMLSKPLLLIIDMQNVYSPNQKWECHNFNQTTENILRLIQNGRHESVVFTRYIASKNPHGVWLNYNLANRDINQNKWANEIISELKEYREEYPIYDKSTYSALKLPELKRMANAASCVVITGVVAECCVLSTVMDLIDAGIYVIYIKDAISGIRPETEKAVETVLSGLCPLHLSILCTEEYLSQPISNLPRRI